MLTKDLFTYQLVHSLKAIQAILICLLWQKAILSFFRLPARRSWLRKYNWLAGEEFLAPYVESFKLYLPLKEYKSGNEKQHSRTRIELTSVAGSSFSETSNIVYNLPFQDSNYLAIYTQGYDQCPNGKEASNPYSLCKNLPKICDTNTRVPTITKSIMPTILSTWKVRYTVESGEIDLTWNAPNPATNLLMTAKVKLRFLPNPNLTKRRVLWHHRDQTAFGCCTGNASRPKWRDKRCVQCPSKPNGPTNSISNLRGYYCEKGKEDVAGEPPESKNTNAQGTNNNSYIYDNRRFLDSTRYRVIHTQLHFTYCL